MHLRGHSPSSVMYLALILIASSWVAHADPFAIPDSTAAPNATAPIEKDACSSVWQESKYNMKMHIAAIFIVLGTSGFGILSAVFIASNKYLSKRQGVLFAIQALKFFGIGVILATAWIHLLTPAFDAFSSECLLKHGHWGRYGTAYVGLFGMIAAFFVQGLEFCALSRGDSQAKKKAKASKEATEHAHDDADVAADLSKSLKTEEPEECVIPHAHTHDHNHEHEHKPHKPKKEHHVDIHDVTGHSHDVVSGVLDVDDHGSTDLATLFLEVGIIFHSVIIGLALGVATDEFKSLLVAVIFHQLFEGIALGVRLAEVKSFNSWKKFAAALLYPVTTPVGIAVGIGIRRTFNSNAFRAILVQGIFDSLSAGILFYNGYVELMAFEMNRNAVFRAHNAPRKIALFVAVYLGAAVMAIIGLWA